MDLNDCRNMAILAMCEHGLIQGIPGQGENWSFKFDGSRQRFGLCHHSRKTISLSRHLVALNPDHEVKLTLLHEIAHALTPGHGHDSVWSAKSKAIGGSFTRCYNAADNGRAVVTVQAPYIGYCSNTFCPQHTRTWPVHRRKQTLVCGLCRSKIYFRSSEA